MQERDWSQRAWTEPMLTRQALGYCNQAQLSQNRGFTPGRGCFLGLRVESVALLKICITKPSHSTPQLMELVIENGYSEDRTENNGASGPFVTTGGAAFFNCSSWA